MWLLLGAGALVVLLGAAHEFRHAEVASLKGLVAWVVTLGGLALCTMLLLTGRESAAIGALLLAGPLAWSWWQEGRRGAAGAGRRPGPGPSSGSGRALGGAAGRMSREEALSVLGLRRGASEPEIREAWKRLMRGAHPDRGGSDWLAARVNEARDVLLRRGG